MINKSLGFHFIADWVPAMHKREMTFPGLMQPPSTVLVIVEAKISVTPYPIRTSDPRTSDTLGFIMIPTPDVPTQISIAQIFDGPVQLQDPGSYLYLDLATVS